MIYILDLLKVSKMTHNLNQNKASKIPQNRDLPSHQKNIKTIFFVRSIKMLNQSLKELKAIEKMRGIKGYKSMSEDELLSALNL